MSAQRAIVRAVLADGEWHSNLEFLAMGITRAAARVHELRAAGIAIETRTRRGHVADYRMLDERQEHEPAETVDVALPDERGESDVAAATSAPVDAARLFEPERAAT